MKQYTCSKKKNMQKQLTLFKLLTEDDKTHPPAVIARQDRGRLKCPHRLLLPFCQASSSMIKQSLNLPALMKDGRKITQV